MEKTRTQFVVFGFAIAGAAYLHWKMQKDNKQTENELKIAAEQAEMISREATIKLEASDEARWAVRSAYVSVESDRPPQHEATKEVNCLWDMYAEFRDLNMQSDPITASMYGDHRYGHLLTDLSWEGYNKNIASIKKFQTKLKTQIPDVSYLPPNEHANYQFLLEMVELTLKKYASWCIYEVPTNQLFGPHLEFVPAVLQFSPRDTFEERRDLLNRLKSFDRQVNQIIQAFKKGIETKKTLPATSIFAIIAQCEAQVLPSFDKSPLAALIQPSSDGGGGGGGGNMYELSYLSSVEDLVMNSVMPAYYKLADFLSNEYILHARPSSGIYCWEGSSQIYQAAIAYFTSLPNITANEIHQVGLEQVERIKLEMIQLIEKHGLQMLSTDELKQQTGLLLKEDKEDKGDDKGDDDLLSKFMLALKSDPKQQPESGDEIIKKYRDILTIALKISKEGLNGQPPIFNLLPKADYEIKPVEPFREQHAPPAFYYPPSADGKRGGIFYANTFKPKDRGMFIMESIALHEAIPGHHFQIALAQELGGSPWLRKQSQDFCTAYIEGWGLYTEKLGIEMGFYQDPCQDFGRLTTEMMRAVRLVIDSGLHAKNWTREQAVSYFKAHSAMGDQDIGAEVDRYMVFPGQAVSYKIGELKILQLRKFCEDSLGDQFKLSEFHDIILGSGALPLATLEETVHNWASSKK